MISSPKNPRIKQVVALRDRRERDLTGLTRVEGYEEVNFVLNSGARPAALYFCPSMFRTAPEVELLEKLRRTGVEATEVSEEVFDRLA
jgi:RNA methyltransferase, TrmH family